MTVSTVDGVAPFIHTSSDMAISTETQQALRLTGTGGIFLNTPSADSFLEFTFLRCDVAITDVVASDRRDNACCLGQSRHYSSDRIV